MQSGWIIVKSTYDMKKVYKYDFKIWWRLVDGTVGEVYLLVLYKCIDMNWRRDIVKLLCWKVLPIKTQDSLPPPSFPAHPGRVVFFISVFFCCSVRGLVWCQRDNSHDNQQPFISTPQILSISDTPYWYIHFPKHIVFYIIYINLHTSHD